MSEYVEITPNQIEVARIERDTGIYTPTFISDLKPIDREQAADFGTRYKLHHYVRPGETKDFVDYWASKAALQYCRIRGITLDQAEATIDRDPSYTTEELFGMFTPERYEAGRESLVIQEQLRRQKRDAEIFRMEISLIQKRDIKLKTEPHSIIDVCELLAKESNKIFNRDYTSAEVYWDLMEHYSELMAAAQRSFNPLEEWKQYLNGDLDISRHDNWRIQNVGKHDLSYYDMTRGWKAPRSAPTRTQYDSNLLFHATSIEAANNIVRSGYLHPRVCYSAGQVLSDRYEVALIFKKTDVTTTYSALPYIESLGSHEREIRSNEENSINFCIGCVPIDKELFPDIYTDEGWYYPEHPSGRIAAARWEKNLNETGTLWTETDREEILEVIHKKSPLQFGEG